MSHRGRLGIIWQAVHLNCFTEWTLSPNLVAGVQAFNHCTLQSTDANFILKVTKMSESAVILLGMSCSVACLTAYLENLVTQNNRQQTKGASEGRGLGQVWAGDRFLDQEMSESIIFSNSSCSHRSIYTHHEQLVPRRWDHRFVRYFLIVCKCTCRVETVQVMEDTFPTRSSSICTDSDKGLRVHRRPRSKPETM